MRWTAIGAMLALAVPTVAAAKAPAGIVADSDRDHDGRVTRSEYYISGETRFAGMDRDKDGYLSVEERVPARAPNGLPPISRERPGDVDADGDARVSRTEFFYNRGILFARWDTNGDNAITADEAEPPRAP